VSEEGTQDRGAVHTMLDVSGDDPAGLDIDRLERDARVMEGIGRYHILSRVGAGGMGVVYAAYDPDLDRRVAIKLLHNDTSEPGSRSDGRSMLLREAKAMAKLSHPHVVAVHDVGVHGGAVYVAMEYVHGQTVAEWIAGGARAWPEVVRVFIAAARGLAAAHAAGLVHRDFKPANVLLANDGAVKVSDFGLARWRDDAQRDRGPTEEAAIVRAAIASGSGGSSHDPPTQAGVVMGTPAYMAPEQHLGLPIDARSDQFSFCVALHEALYGTRPFTSAAPSALAMDIVEGRVPEAPAGTKVPTWLREVLLRGLEPDPELRHPSMNAIIALLERDPSARRRRMGFMAGGVGLVGVATLGVLMVGPRATPCGDMGAHLVGVWDSDTREQVQSAIFATGVGFAQSTWERVERRLDEYTDAWLAQRTDACVATRVRGDQSEALLDLRMACLDGRLRGVRALVTVLAEADETVVGNAVVATAGLAPLAACEDTEAVRKGGHTPDDPQLRDSLAQLDQRLADAEQRGHAGKYPEALALARTVVEDAEAIGFAPMIARASRRRGWLEHTNGDDPRAEETLSAAYFQAVRLRDDALAGQAAIELVTVVGEFLHRADDGRRWAEHAAAHADASGDAVQQAAVAHALAGVALREGKYDEAERLASAALRQREELLGEDDEDLLASLNTLGLVAIETGKFADARNYFERMIALAEPTLGADHPELAKPMNNLANIAWREGKYEQAKASFERALQLQRAALGDDHRNVAQLENNLAAVALSTGHHAEAEERFERALAIWRAALGDDHPLIADALNNLAVVAVARGKPDLARERDEHALAIREKTMPPDHPGLAQNLINLGTDYYRLGRYAEARVLHERGLAIYEKKLDPSHDDIALGLTALANDMMELGDVDDALPMLERAHAMRKDAEIDPVELAGTRWSLARALHDAKTGRDPARARALAQQAREVFAAAPTATDNPLVAIEAFLAR
jgi:tetratricopeptide (TPR) repeat protein